MCQLFISDDGMLIAPAIIRIPAINFVAPILRGNPLITSIKPSEDNVAFIVDTGAQITCLSGLDADRLHVETRYLERAEDVIGVGGTCGAYRLRNIEIGLVDDVTPDRITFHIEKLEYICVIDSLKMRSLLGMDLLSKFDLSTDRRKSAASLVRITDAPGEYQIVSRELTKRRKRTPRK
jgi:hypothetical protein